MNKLIKSLFGWLGFSQKKEHRKSRYDYVYDLILKAKRHEWEMGNKPTTLTISYDLLDILERNNEFIWISNMEEGRILGLDVKVDYEKKLHISVD